MSFGYERNSGIPFLDNYADALARYENTTDIRGRVAEPKRPLGHRRGVDNYSIVKLENGDIQCVLWKTPVVTFHPDDSVTLFDGSWTTSSTAYFISDVLRGIAGRVFTNKICLYLYGRGEEFFLPKNTPFKMCRTNGYWQPVEVKSQIIHHIRRKESNNVMKAFEDFIAYVENMRKLRTDAGVATFNIAEYVEVGLCSNDNSQRYILGDLNRASTVNFPNVIRDFVAWTSDTSENKHESYYKALLLIVNSVAWINWHNNERVMKDIQWREAMNLIKNIAWGINRDKVFKEVECPVGVVRRDTYGRFFEYGWNEYHKVA